MLTPRSDDPNREAELKRLKQDPKSFGDKPPVPKDWQPNDAEKPRRGRPRKGE